MAPSLMDRSCGDRLNVAGREVVCARVQLPFDDGRVGHDAPTLFEDEVEAPEGMIPVFIGEPLGGVGPGGCEELPERFELLRR